MLSCSRDHRIRSLSQRRPLLTTLGLAALGLAAGHPAPAQTAVLTQNNDNARSGANPTETVLTPANVNVTNFGKLFTITGLNANVNGQALYVPDVVIGGIAHNIVYAYTSNNTDNSPCGLYAYDADSAQRLWATTLPNSATYTTATPAIDAATNTIYVLTKTGTDNTGLTYLHAFDITTGQDKPGSPIQVQASAAGTGDGSVNGIVYFDGDHGNGRFHANDRAGLLFSNGVVYAAFAHNSDSNPYHGWVLGYQYNGSAFTQKYVFCTTPNGSASTTPGGGDGGIWQSGKGLTADAAGNIYFSVGNGTFDANVGGIDYGMCYMKLSPALKVLDWFAPYDEQARSNSDLDLGNTGLAGIPGTTSLFAGATKFGSAFLLDSADLGHFTANGPDKVLDRIDGVSGNDNVGQNPISWDTGGYKYVYVWPSGDPIRQFRYDPAIGNFSPSGIFTTTTNSATSGGSLAVSSNGASNGILWAVASNGGLRAYDATNVANTELWDSGQNSSRDALGGVGHFQFPTVVNGKVYVPTNAATIAVYGLLPTTQTASTLNDTSGSISYSGSSWFYNPKRNLGDIGNDVHAATANGDSFSYTFTATGVSYIAETNSDEGNVQVYLDGTLQTTVNCYTATRQAGRTLWSVSGLSSGSHTLKIVKASGSFMLLDALQVTPGFVTTLNDTASGIAYSGSNWFYSSGRGVNDIGNDVHATTVNGASVSYTFTGTQISYVAETNSDEGSVQVYLDGVLQATVNCATTTRQIKQSVYSVSGLPLGSHTLKLVKTSGNYMVLDALRFE